MKTPKNPQNVKVGEEEILPSKKQEDLKMNVAINTALEFDMAFKLMSYRVANKEMFLNRVHDLSTFLINEFNEIEKNHGQED